MKDCLIVEISLDGNMWCALVGSNPQEGLAGFGQSPVEAIRALCDELEQHTWGLPDVLIW